MLQGFGIQIRKPREPGEEAVSATDRLSRVGHWFLAPKNNHGAIRGYGGTGRVLLLLGIAACLKP